MKPHLMWLRSLRRLTIKIIIILAMSIEYTASDRTPTSVWDGDVQTARRLFLLESPFLTKATEFSPWP